MSEPAGTRPDFGGVREEFIADLKGKRYPTYPGVLDLAHRMGLTSLAVRIIQPPSNENKNEALCEATATFVRDGTTYIFVEVGDASPANTKLTNATLRIAATRAKGRALRDGTNVGETLLEEVPEEGFEPPPQRATVRVQAPQGETRSATRQAPAANAPTQSPDHAKKLTRYEDLRAELISYGHKDPGPILANAATAFVEQRARDIWPSILAYRARGKRENAEEPTALEAPPPAEETPPAEGEKKAVTKAQLWDGWQHVAQAADKYGLPYEKLTERTSGERLLANGRALRDTVREVEQNLKIAEELNIRAAEYEGVQWITYDREHIDPNALKADVQRMAVLLGQMDNEVTQEAPAPNPFDPFEEE